MLRVVTQAIFDLANTGVIPRDLSLRTLSASTAIDDLGLDSLSKLNLLSELEERANVMLSESILPGLRTLGDLAAILTSLQS